MNAIVVFLVVVVMVIGIFVISVRHHEDKLKFGVPWFQWLSLDEIVALGHSRFLATILLPAFYRTRSVEIRIAEGLSDAEYALADRIGLCRITAPLYEYRFVERWTKGKKKPIKLFDFGLQPVTA